MCGGYQRTSRRRGKGVCRARCTGGPWLECEKYLSQVLCQRGKGECIVLQRGIPGTTFPAGHSQQIGPEITSVLDSNAR